MRGTSSSDIAQIADRVAGVGVPGAVDQMPHVVEELSDHQALLVTLGQKREIVRRAYVARCARVNIDAMAAAVLARITPATRQPSTSPTLPTPQPSRFERYGVRIRHTPMRRAIAIVTTAVILLVVGLAVGRYTPDRAQRTSTAASITYATQNGQRAEITLPDGTHVTLNVASRIDIPVNFGVGDRTVQLHGEAYFRVSHQTKEPFVIAAGNTRTTVLGTEFGVRAYRPTNVRVAVRDGRVSVNRTILTARDVARVVNGDISVTHDQPVEKLLGFTTGRLILSDLPLRDAIDDLDRWYNVTIKLGDVDVGEIPINAILTNGSIGDLMEMLRVTFDLRVVQSGRTVTVYRR